MNACKALATHQAGAGQGELQAAEASLRVPLRIICTPLLNWLYVKGCRLGVPGLAHGVRGVWHLAVVEFLLPVLFPTGIGDVVW